MATKPLRSASTTPGTRRGRRGVLALGAAAALGALAMVATGGTAFAAAHSARAPHAIASPFEVFGGGGLGSGAVLPGGNYVLAAPSNSGAVINVCNLKTGDRRCVSKAVLHPYAHDEFFGGAYVVATGGSDVSVVADDCCHIGDNNLDVYNSTNDGKTWTKLIAAGDLDGETSVTRVGGQIIAGVNDHNGTQIQAFSPSAAGKSGYHPATEIATLNSHGPEDTYVTSYKNGVLVAADNGNEAFVWYAKAGSDFSNYRSYKLVGKFGHETVTALSGSAFQTDIEGGLTGNERLRFFNGTTMPSAGFKVPEPKNGDDTAFNMVQVGGKVHEFFLNRRNHYDVYTATTSNGHSWSSLTVYPHGTVTAGWLSPVLGTNGSGLLLQTDSGGHAEEAQPVGTW